MRICLAIAALSLLWTNTLWSGAFKVLEVNGDSAQYRENGKLKKAQIKKGMDIPAGSRVVMKDGLLVLKTPMGDLIRFRGKTYVKLSKVSDGKGGKTEVEMELYNGKLKSQVKKLKNGSSFLVKTPVAVAGVRGTIFSIKVAETGETDVLVYEGEVGVQDAEGESEPKSVPAGSAAKVKSDGEVKVKAVVALKKSIENKKVKAAAKKAGKKAGEKAGGGAKKEDGEKAGGDGEKAKSEDGEKEEGGEGEKAEDGEKEEGGEGEEGAEPEGEEGEEPEGEEPEGEEPEGEESGLEFEDEESFAAEEDFGEEIGSEDDLFDTAGEDIEVDEDVIGDIVDTIADEVQDTVQDELQQIRDEEQAEEVEEAQEAAEQLDLKFDIESIE